MGILTTTDALTIVPSLASLSTNDLGALVNYVNFLVESPNGANRPLGIQQFTEKLRLTLKLQNCYISYRPLLLDDPVNYPVVAQMRIANALNYYGRAIPLQPWITLDSTQISLESDGQLNLFLSAAYFYNFPEFSQSVRTIATEVKISYYSGLDLSSITPTQEVTNLKIAAGEICKYLQSNLYKGVSSVQVPFDEFSLGFNSSLAPYKVPGYLLYPFLKYKPTLKY